MKDATTGFIYDTQLSFNGDTASPKAEVDFKSFKISAENGQAPKISKSAEYTVGGLKFKLELTARLSAPHTVEFEGTCSVDKLFGECEFNKGDKRKASLKDFGIKYTVIVKKELDDKKNKKVLVQSFESTLKNMVLDYKENIVSNGSPDYLVVLKIPADLKKESQVRCNACIDKDFNETFDIRFHTGT